MKLQVVLHKPTNQKAHHTDEYMHEIDELVVRRGQPFNLSVKVNGRKFNKDTDHLKMIFSTGVNGQSLDFNLHCIMCEFYNAATKARLKCYTHVCGPLFLVAYFPLFNR